MIHANLVLYFADEEDGKKTMHFYLKWQKYVKYTQILQIEF